MEPEESWTQTQEGGPDAMLQTEERRSDSRPALMRAKAWPGTGRRYGAPWLWPIGATGCPAVRRRLAQAVQAALGAPAHRVECFPGGALSGAAG